MTRPQTGVALEPARIEVGGAGRARRKALEASALAGAPLNAKGFAGFFADEWPRLKAYLERRLPVAEAEDVAQEAFARLWRAHAHAPLGFLYAVARNLVVDAARQRARARLDDDSALAGLADPSPSPEDVTVQRTTLRAVEHVIARMSDKRRGVFLLRVAEGLSYAEIAERTGLSKVAVEKHLVRAFEKCAEARAQCAEDKSRNRGAARAKR